MPPRIPMPQHRIWHKEISRWSAVVDVTIPGFAKDHLSNSRARQARRNKDWRQSGWFPESAHVVRELGCPMTISRLLANLIISTCFLVVRGPTCHHLHWSGPIPANCAALFWTSHQQDGAVRIPTSARLNSHATCVLRRDASVDTVRHSPGVFRVLERFHEFDQLRSDFKFCYHA